MYKRVKEYLGTEWEAYRKAFESALESRSDLLNKINEYLFSRPGKQLRPLFSLLTAKACASGFCSESAISCAAACEMLHTATLLHDDVVDNADTRRGAPTVKAIASSSAAVLIGDYWLSKVVEVIVHNCDQRVILYYAKCLQDLAEGEMLQLEKAQSLDTTEEDYFAIIYRKTASLFETSIKGAAYVSHASEDILSSFEQYACHVGLAFQIMDDIFDYSPNLSTGKPAGLDVLERKITLPLLGAFANSPEAELSHIKSLMAQIGDDEAKDKEISDEIVEFVHRRGGIEYSQARLDNEIALAIDALRDLPASEAKDYLIELAKYLIKRDR